MIEKYFRWLNNMNGICLPVIIKKQKQGWLPSRIQTVLWPQKYRTFLVDEDTSQQIYKYCKCSEKNLLKKRTLKDLHIKSAVVTLHLFCLLKGSEIRETNPAS